MAFALGAFMNLGKIVNIEKELRLIKGDAQANHAFVGLFNLIIFCSEQSRQPSLQDTVQAIVKKFPSRVIFIQKNDTQTDDFLSIQVSNKIEGKEGGSIPCDHIYIEVSPKQLQRIPFIIIPHLLPDLPIYLLWDQNPAIENHILPHLLPFAKRLIFDSDCAADLQAFSKTLLKFMDQEPNVDFIDLNWVRIAGWRNVLREVFDSATANQRLRFNKNIQICYNNKPSTQIQHQEHQAIYLAAWMIAQLKWKWVSSCREDSLIKITCSNGNNDFSITLSPENHSTLNPGAIVEVEVASNDNHFFFITPMENLPKAVVHISSMETCELPFTLPLHGIKKGAQFTTELIFSPASVHYRNMLSLFVNQASSCLI